MGESIFVVGGSPLSPPTPLSKEEFDVYDQVIRAVTEDGPLDVDDESGPALQEAREIFALLKSKSDYVKVEVHRINEPGAAGPGRAMDVAVSWKDKEKGSTRTTKVYPRGRGVCEVVYTIRNLLNHAWMVP